MAIQDSVELVAGAPLVVIIPALVELAKRQGMPIRYAGLAAIVIATVLLALAGLTIGESPGIAEAARWVIGGIVYGLAAAGLYSQRDILSGQEPDRGQPHGQG